MNRALLIASLIAFSGSVGVYAGTATARSSTDAAKYELTVTTVADAKHPGVYRCTATFKNASTSEVISQPILVFRAGEDAQIRSSDQNSTFTMKISSDEKKNSAMVLAEYSLAGEVVFAPLISLELR